MTTLATETAIWPDTATATLFLRGCMGDMPDDATLRRLKQLDQQRLVAWITRFQLGAIVCREYQAVWPDLAAALASERFAIMAQNTLHFESISSAIEVLETADLPLVVLKGCSLAEAAWGDMTMRPMSDADLWIPAASMQPALEKLYDIGYQPTTKTSSIPLERQRIVTGVIELARPGWQYGMLDIHWRPLHGWWMRHCANIDFDGMWQRRVPIAVNGKPTSRLSNEDQLLHLAIHASVNAHFGSHAGIRGLLDIVFCVQAWPVDWDVVVARAKAYRLKTAVWFVLDLARQMLAWDEVAAVLPRLAPSQTRQNYLRRLVNPESILAGHDISPTKWRFALIFGLADRRRDVGRYLYHTVIPEEAWRTAKYGRSVPAWHHLTQSIRKTS